MKNKSDKIINRVLIAIIACLSYLAYAYDKPQLNTLHTTQEEVQAKYKNKTNSNADLVPIVVWETIRQGGSYSYSSSGRSSSNTSSGYSKSKSSSSTYSQRSNYGGSYSYGK